MLCGLMKSIRGFLCLLFVAGVVLAVEGSAAGVKWTVPAAWKAQPERPMRVATYDLPAAPGSEAGECGVFYFGQGQGGSVEENLSRWAAQFEGGSPKKATKSIHGLQVHTIDISGTYLAPSGPMMKSSGKKPDYRLLGAIVEGPQGNVFFKGVGPAATMSKAQADFDSLVASVAKAPAAKL
jgi:hypothetical protein